jgi:hypothetical protein
MYEFTLCSFDRFKVIHYRYERGRYPPLSPTSPQPLKVLMNRTGTGMKLTVYLAKEH